MHRFFISKESFGGDAVAITGETAHQIATVLRLKPADRIMVLDNTGMEYEIELGQVRGELVRGKIVKKERGAGEPMVRITLYQALLKSARFEFVLQKCVELGISGFVPFVSARCVVAKVSGSRLARWQKIIREAAEQSHRAVLPVLHPPVSFERACQSASPPALLLWEGEKNVRLAPVLRSELFQQAPRIGVFVGPEGGFPEAEVALARRYGIVTAGLGKRILRAETAGIAAVSAMMYARGEVG